MRILWKCNGKPEGLDNEVQKGSGGWITGLLQIIRNRENIELDVVYPNPHTTNLECFGNVRAKGLKSNLKQTKYDSAFECEFRNFMQDNTYDCIHIWGTEFPHTLAVVNVCHELNMDEKVLIGIQGLCGFIAHHYTAGLTRTPITFRDIVRMDPLRAQKRTFERRGVFEKEAIKKCTHITGRTDWDKICTGIINPQRQYHYCNEILRDAFYHKKWNLDSCEKYRIFASQAYYPLKGLHYLLKAVSILRNHGKPVELYVAGTDITSVSAIRMGGYGVYLKRMIRKYKLQNYVHFTGPLTAEEMAEQLQKAHVFVLPSSIENSPNSLAEAMLIGTPCVASDVGGVKDMLQHKEEGFVYQPDAFYMLAGYVNRIFDDDDAAICFSEKARKRAFEDHNPEINAELMIDIYKQIALQDSK